jgi:hypothetical protein
MEYALISLLAIEDDILIINLWIDNVLVIVLINLFQSIHEFIKVDSWMTCNIKKNPTYNFIYFWLECVVIGYNILNKKHNLKISWL